jgi:maltose O-acetyltransferase
MKIGKNNRFERGLLRRAKNINIGDNNAFSHSYQLWPADEAYDGSRIVIGNNNYFNHSLMLDASGVIKIGNHNMFGPDIYITDSNHKFGEGISPGQTNMERGTVRIGDHCWLGAKVVILKNVTLGNYCVVGAGSVVTKSFPDGSVIAGVPAKIIKQTTNS